MLYLHYLRSVLMYYEMFLLFKEQEHLIIHKNTGLVGFKSSARCGPSCMLVSTNVKITPASYLLLENRLKNNFFTHLLVLQIPLSYPISKVALHLFERFVIAASVSVSALAGHLLLGNILSGQSLKIHRDRWAFYRLTIPDKLSGSFVKAYTHPTNCWSCMTLKIIEIHCYKF